MVFVSPKLLFWFSQYSNFRRKLEVKNGIIVIICADMYILSMLYLKQFWYWYTGMTTQILAPAKWNIPLLALLFCIAGYVSGTHFINLGRIKAESTWTPLTGFEPRKPYWQSRNLTIRLLLHLRIQRL